MDEKLNFFGNIFQEAILSEKPAEMLFDKAKKCLENDDLENLHDIDVMLNDRFIALVRSGTREDLESFLYAALFFVESDEAKKMMAFEEGRRLFYRWGHFHDLSDIAVGKYDSGFVSRFVTSRKNGPDMMKLLYENEEGIRAKDLADRLGISQQNFAKLARQFENEGVIERQRSGKVTMVKLSSIGRFFMEEQYQNRNDSENMVLEPDMEQVIEHLSENKPADWLTASMDMPEAA